MCQMYMKLPTMFDQNPPHTFDKIVKKLQKMLSKLDLDPKCQGHSRNQKLMTWGIKNMSPEKNFSRGSLRNWCDAHADADANSSKTIRRPPFYVLVSVSQELPYSWNKISQKKQRLQLILVPLGKQYSQNQYMKI